MPQKSAATSLNSDVPIVLNMLKQVLISQKCIKGVYNGVTTEDLDTLAAETAV